MRKLPKNRRERQIAEQYMKDGWEVLKKGWPDFLMIKDGQIKMIEVKRTCKTRKQGLSAHQQRMRHILMAHHNYEVVYLD